jgi:hypothetical protein
LHGFEPYVERPQGGGCSQPNGREQMRIDISDAPPEQSVRPDEVQDFGIRCSCCSRAP